MTIETPAELRTKIRSPIILITPKRKRNGASAQSADDAVKSSVLLSGASSLHTLPSTFGGQSRASKALMSMTEEALLTSVPCGNLCYTTAYPGADAHRVPGLEGTGRESGGGARCTPIRHAHEPKAERIKRHGTVLLACYAHIMKKYI